MGLIFSKVRNKVAPVQANIIPSPRLNQIHRSPDIDDINSIVQGQNHHAPHPSTVSYDFNTAQGQMRAILAWQAEKDKKVEDEECIENAAHTGNFRSTCST